MAHHLRYRRRSIRLKGYDYAQPGSYFITICTNKRRCILGEIRGGVMHQSRIGNIVERCWRAIPEHFPVASVKTFEIMPNHIHGIITIKEQPVGAEYIQPLQRKTKRRNLPRFQQVVPKSLGSIIRTFKAAVTREVHKTHSHLDGSLWQRNYFEHIVRDDVSHFFIEQYIELNPLLWHLDVDNPDFHEVPMHSFQQQLTRRYGIRDHALAYVMQLEEEYRLWRVDQENEFVMAPHLGSKDRTLLIGDKQKPH